MLIYIKGVRQMNIITDTADFLGQHMSKSLNKPMCQSSLFFNIFTGCLNLKKTVYKG